LYLLVLLEIKATIAIFMRGAVRGIFLGKLFFICLFISMFFSPSVSHEINYKKLTIYHPYLIIDTANKAHAFMSIENTSKESEYLVDIKSKFSSKFEVIEINDNDNLSVLNLSDGLEIPPGEVLFFEAETLKLIFSELRKDISWFNPHLAEFVFKNAGVIEVDFEVEQ